ncbi:glycosyltransferase family 4 protein [Flavobacterium sp.]|jgi:glycosyltransferase involved in cell wall biosynthesis|uniref:glycosyltransferase family 4 protein n=1 Tax=Flavobacterium sp. TaxID=239 RepID=UPI003783D529
MRILVLHQYFLEENDSGGSRWNEITKFWSDQEHEITVLGGMIHANGNEKLPEYKGKWFKRKHQGNVEVIRCHVSESYNLNFLGRLWGYFSFMFSSLYAGIFMTKGKYDVIIVTSPPLFVGMSGYIISLFKRSPFLFEIRDLWPESAIDTGVVKNKLIIKLAFMFERFIYKRAKLINVLTPAFQKKLIEVKQIAKEKIIFIPNAADFSLSDDLLTNFDAEAFRKQLEINDNFVITYVGAHGVANHLEQILDAALLLKDTNVIFLLIGQGMEKPRLKEYAELKQIRNVKFLDPVPKKEVFKYILASDMGASVLKNVETFKTVYSNKTFDYLACKKPIFMAIDGISRELIEQADAGIFVEPENSKDFSEKIRLYLEKPNEIIRQGENGYQYAKNNFDRIKLAQNYIDQIKKII